MKEYLTRARRKFLGNSLKIGLLTALGTFGISKWVSRLSAKSKSSIENTTEVLTVDGKLIEVPVSALQEIEPSHVHDETYNVREGIPNRKFVMVIDLAKCKNALNCQESCNKHHYITGDNAWLKVYKMQETEDTAPYWMPATCMHCDKPACVTVCPVDATFKRRDGLVLIDNERCIGCRFCMAACPYSTRVFNWNEPEQQFELNLEMIMEQSSPEYAGVPSLNGTVDKCDFCPHMIKKGELPHCVTACPNGVFYFGDKYEDTVTNGEETLRFKKLLKDKAGYRLMEDLGTEPSVYYLPPVDRLVEFEDGLENYNEFQSVAKPEEQ
ncbi:MAG: 4Fe-4S dicluster domain-containing protein [Flavobacteriaceae bacterium]